MVFSSELFIFLPSTERFISYRIKDPTNTCYPHTGNWCEHLMHIEWLENILKREGFIVKTMSGYYDNNDRDNIVKKYTKNLLNTLITKSGRRGLVISSYYVLCGDYNRDSLN